ncbi:MAG: glycosyltransferase [Clostridiales bacterium]|nr:glycosyltransferase [Clostridiales bacterium]
MIAKYLAKRGHHVTVLRSGMIDKIADHFYPALENVRVISFLGKDCPAERFERGELICNTASDTKSRIAFLPLPVRKILSSIYHWADTPRQYSRRMRRTAQRLELQKRIIDSLKSDRIDIVFSTFSDLENAYAGEYAKKVLGCKWIMDFRDPIAQEESQTHWEYKRYKTIQDRIIQGADICTAVSDNLLVNKKTLVRDAKIKTVYNGYDTFASKDGLYENVTNDILTLCYTGQIYGQRAAAASALIKAISILINNGVIKKNKIRIVYAGSGSDELRMLLRSHEIEEVLENHGYLSKNEVIELQKACDLFIVLTWNTHSEKGVLTGKFYEALQQRKPIIALVNGNTPNSELKMLIDRYNLGICYEEATKEQSEQLLVDYLKKQIARKQRGENMEYKPDESVFTRFQYSEIAKRLEQIMKNLVG